MGNRVLHWNKLEKDRVKLLLVKYESIISVHISQIDFSSLKYIYLIELTVLLKDLFMYSPLKEKYTEFRFACINPRLSSAAQQMEPVLRYYQV